MNHGFLTINSAPSPMALAQRSKSFLTASVAHVFALIEPDYVGYRTDSLEKVASVFFTIGKNPPKRGGAPSV